MEGQREDEIATSSAISGFANVGPEINVEENLSDPEILLLRHKRFTSGYESEDVCDLSPENVTAEIERVRKETDKIKRNLAALSHKSDQPSCEFDSFAAENQSRSHFKYVTTRAVHHSSEHHPSSSSATASSERHHPGRQLSTCSPATLVVRQPTVRQPTPGRQHSSSSTTTSSVRHHAERQPSIRSPATSVARHPAVRQPTPGRQHASSTPTTSLVRQHAGRLPSLHSSTLPPPLSARSAGTNVGELAAACVTPACVEVKDKVNKSKHKYCSVDVSSSDEASDVASDKSDRAVFTYDRSDMKSSKSKPLKSVVCSRCNSDEITSTKNNSVESKICSDSSKKNRKLSDKSVRSRKSFVHVESCSESDNNSSAAVKRCSYIKPDKFDGVTPAFATFKAHFENAAEFNKWSKREQLAFLKSSLTGSAAQCLWDQSPECTDTLEKLWKLLSDRFGGQNLTEKYRTELRNRRRKPGESLDSLCQDIRRLLILGYPGPASSAHEAIARDSFIGALPSELSLKVWERDPKSLDEALHDALRFEAIQTAAATRDQDDDNGRARGRARAVVSSNNNSADSAVMSKLNEIQTRFDSHLKTFSGRLDNLESTMRRQSNTSDQQPVNTFSVNPNAGTWTPVVSQTHEWNNDMREQTGTTRTNNLRSANPRACFICGDTSHLKRQCPHAANMSHSGQRQPSSQNASNIWSTGHNRNLSSQRTAAATRGSHGQLDNGNVYLVVHVDGRRHLALLDSGCELSLAPNNLVGRYPLRPTSHHAYAANGSPIHVIGETDIEFESSGHMFFATVLVTEDVSELMLGIAWLTAQYGVWDFYNRTLYVDGIPLPLHTKKSGNMCRRVYVQENVVLAPRQQVDVPSRSTVNNISVSESNDWLLDTKQIRPGVLVARTLLPDQHRGIAVRVVNTTTEPQELRQNTCLGNIQPVEVCGESNTQEQCDVETVPSVAGQHTDIDPVSEMLQSLPEELTDDQREAVTVLLHKYKDVFSTGEFDVGCTRLIEHHIDTGQHRPVRQALRRHPTAYLDAIDEYVEQLRNQDMIEPSGGPWCSNVVVVRRKDGRLRLCVDYRGLNARTYFDSYPMPNIEATLDALGGSSWFCTLDLRSGYHNVVIAEQDRDKTQFITRRGTYRWKRMPFGLSTAPGTFQRLMDLVMCGLSYESVLVYLDDLIVMASSFEQLMQKFTEVLERLRAANLKLNCRKCSLFQRKVSFLGHIVSSAGIEVQPDKTEAVNNWPVPNSLSELRSFLGLASYYRRFIKDFSIIASPLTALTRKGCQFHWNDEQQQAFNELKTRLTTAPILSTPRSVGTYYLDTDAANSGLGVVLSQEQDGQERVLAYASRSLSLSERNYSITRKELLAVIFGLKRFRPYLIARKFVIRTDHSALQWLRKTPEPVAQSARWLAIMEEFSFTVQHRLGSRHRNADALSRRPSPCDEEECLDNSSQNDRINAAVRTTLTVDPDYHPRAAAPSRPTQDESNFSFTKMWHVYSAEEMANLQQNDIDVGPIARLRLQSEVQPSLDSIRDQSVNTKVYWSQWPRLVVRDGVVYRVMFDRNGKPAGTQLLVPTRIRNEIMDIVHTGLTGSHCGMGKTMAQLSRRAWWHGWRADVRRYCRRCSRCCRYHRGTLPRHGTLQPTRVGAVFERVSIDLTGPHVRSRRGYVYILTVVCSFSKWCECIPLRNKEATTVARALVEQVFCRFGTPLALLSDRGGEVDGHIMREVCKLLQVEKLRTSAYHPACNAACERMHRTLNSLLGKVVSEAQTDWDEYLPFVAAALRASKSESTGYSANFLMLGREVNAPAEIVYGLASPEQLPTYDEFVESVREKMSEAYDLVRNSLGKAAERNKRYYDMRAKPMSFSEGQSVYYFNPRRYCGRADKWARKYTGPFRIIKVLTPVNLLLQKNPRSKPFVTHVDKVKLCYERENDRLNERRLVPEVEMKDEGAIEDRTPRPKRNVHPPVRLLHEC